jgi:hypothetical protein
MSKDRASPSVPFGTGPFSHQYTVSFREASFTVTEPSDASFLDYFYQRCISEEEEETKPIPTLRRRRPAWSAASCTGWPSRFEKRGVYSPHSRASVASAQPSQ